MATTIVGSPGTNLAYDTATLIQVVPNLKRPTAFLLDLAFPNIVMSDDEFVAIDVDIGIRRMAPFVSPLVEGKLVEQRRIQTNIFKPAYIKDKRAPDLRKPIRRMIGERLAGSMTGAEREMANLEFEMTDQIEILTRRLEWMAANVLANGTVTVTGDGFPTVVVDFGRDPALTVTLTGGTQWTATNVAAGTASPTGNIEGWQRTILKKSGAKTTDIIFTTTSWLGFILDPLLKGAIYYPRLGESSNVIDPGPMIETGAVFKGVWGGYRLWVYNEWYVDATGSDTASGVANKEYPMLTDGTLIMTGADMMGTRGFGVILDPAFNYAALPFAPKTWVAEDPAQRFIMMQSSPIVIPSRVNAALGANVATAVYT